MKFLTTIALAAIALVCAQEVSVDNAVQNGEGAVQHVEAVEAGAEQVEKAADGCGRRRHHSSSSSSNDCGLENIKIVPDGGFYPFSFQVPYDPIHQAFYFKSDKLTMVTVVDCFCEGDFFQFYDNGSLIGVTSTNCDYEDYNPDQTCDHPIMDPFQCTRSDNHCMGGAYLLPGFHNITLQTVFSPFSGGTAFIRVDTACQTYNGLVPCCSLPGGNCYNGLGEGFVM